VYYALVKHSCDCGGSTGLLFGKTKRSLARRLLDECKELLAIPMEEDDMTLEDLEDEGAYLDDYLVLKETADPGPIQLLTFSFDLGDASITVPAVANSYEEISLAFDSYAEQMCCFGDWRMPKGIKETFPVLRALDTEMRSLTE
jgi:hypothetical protein